MRGIVLNTRDVSERRRLHSAMGKYLAPAVMEEVLGREGELLGEVGAKLDITVLFTDIRGFTSISEAYSAEQAATVARMLARRALDEAIEHMNTVEKAVKS